MRAERLDGFAHVLRTGGAVQSDHIDGKPFENGEYRSDIRSEQHAPVVSRVTCAWMGR